MVAIYVVALHELNKLVQTLTGNCIYCLLATVNNMKWVIWNKTQDKFWSEAQGEWSNRYYATKYSMEELEYDIRKFVGNNDLILAVVAVSD